ncbi:hypothetical protein DFJ73DRAFT_961375 [Zopfochytrium polystomum]|nr:hypothetical protein DFJ73DRAFT_961375 [Zopfochytrium polystomum]
MPSQCGDEEDCFPFPLENCEQMVGLECHGAPSLRLGETLDRKGKALEREEVLRAAAVEQEDEFSSITVVIGDIVVSSAISVVSGVVCVVVNLMEGLLTPSLAVRPLRPFAADLGGSRRAPAARPALVPARFLSTSSRKLDINITILLRLRPQAAIAISTLVSLIAIATKGGRKKAKPPPAAACHKGILFAPANTPHRHNQVLSDRGQSHNLTFNLTTNLAITLKSESHLLSPLPPSIPTTAWHTVKRLSPQRASARSHMTNSQADRDDEACLLSPCPSQIGARLLPDCHQITTTPLDYLANHCRSLPDHDCHHHHQIAIVLELRDLLPPPYAPAVITAFTITTGLFVTLSRPMAAISTSHFAAITAFGRDLDFDISAALPLPSTLAGKLLLINLLAVCI